MLGLSNPHPILDNSHDDYYLLNGGNRKYYIWNTRMEDMIELYECNLDNILSILRTDEKYRELVCRYIGNIYNLKINPEELKDYFPSHKKNGQVTYSK